MDDFVRFGFGLLVCYSFCSFCTSVVKDAEFCLLADKATSFEDSRQVTMSEDQELKTNTCDGHNGTWLLSSKGQNGLTSYQPLSENIQTLVDADK